MHRPPPVLSRLCLLAGLALACGAPSAAPDTPDTPAASTASTQPTAPAEAPAGVRDTIARDNLWNIARELQADPGVSRQQWMVAIQRLNASAFEDGNMHRLRRNVPLTLPSRQQAAAEDAAQARALVAQHRAALTRGVAEPLPALQAAADTPATPPPPLASAPRADVSAAAASQASTATTAATPAPATSTPTTSEVKPAPPASSEASTEPGHGPTLWWPAAAGLALAGAAFWIWRRPRPQTGSTDEATDTSAPSTFLDQDGVPRRRKARVVEVSQAAADMARTVETLGPVVQLVRRDGETSTTGGAGTASAVPDWVQAYRDLQVDLASAQAEIGREQDARLSLERVRRLGTAAQQREAVTLSLKLA